MNTLLGLLTMSVAKKNGCWTLPLLRKELWWMDACVSGRNGDIWIFPEANEDTLK